MERKGVDSASVTRFQVDGKPVNYSPVMQVSGHERLLFVSGQNAYDKDGNVVGGPDDVEAQIRQTLENIKNLLEEAGASMSDVVKVMAWITRPEYVSAYVKVRQEYFTEPFPASSTVVSDLVLDELLVEIEVVAAL